MKKNPFQVTLYLAPDINREIDRQAKKAKLSRSQFIAKLVMGELRGSPE